MSKLFSTRVCAFVLLALSAWPVRAEAPPAAAAPQPAALVFQNREIVVFRATQLGYSPEERAAEARQRLRALLGKGVSGPVSTRPMAEGTLVEVGGVGVFLIVAGDVDRLGGDNVEAAVQRATSVLSQALEGVREQNNLITMMRAAGAVAVATLLLVALLWLLVHAVRRVAYPLAALATQAAERVKISGYAALSPSGLAGLTRTGVMLLGWAIGLFLGYLWLTFSLERFPYTRPWAHNLLSFLLGVLGTVAKSIAQAIPGLVFVVVIILITRAVVRSVAVFLHRIETGRISVGWLDADTAAPTRRIATVLLWLFALAMAYPYLPGSDSEAFKGVSVLLGLMISIGASGIVGQAAGGLIITYSRTLRLGEYVKIGDTEGTVAELGIFATRIRTGLGEEVTLPNAFVVSNTTHNYSRAVKQASQFVLDTTLTIGYSTPWRQVHAMLLKAASRTRGVLSEPKPFVVQTSLSDFYVAYRLVCYAGIEAPERRVLLLDALHANIQDVFNEHRVQIMSPHYMMDPEQAQIVPKERWYEPPAQPPTSG